MCVAAHILQLGCTLGVRAQVVETKADTVYSLYDVMIANSGGVVHLSVRQIIAVFRAFRQMEHTVCGDVDRRERRPWTK